MHRYRELGVLYDHSQIPVVLARNNSTREVLALQRLPVTSEDEQRRHKFSFAFSAQSPTSPASSGDPRTPLMIPMSDVLQRFPFVDEWSRIPRHPGALLLREVILEGSELFLVSERYSETLVRFLRRQGVLIRTQIKNHALHSSSDSKHDRASGALLDRWLSEGCVPDEEDLDLKDALGLSKLCSGDRNKNNGNNNNNNGLQVSPSGIIILSSSSSSPGLAGKRGLSSLSRETSNLQSHKVLDAAYGAALQRKVSNMDVTSAARAQEQQQQQQQQRRKESVFDPFSANDGDPTGLMMIQPTAVYGESIANVVHSNNNSDEDDENYDSDDSSDSENDNEDDAYYYNDAGERKKKKKKRPEDEDTVPDYHPTVRYADIFRVPSADAQVRLVLFQLLSALAALHANGTAHGHISPKNIVLAARNDLASLRIANFRNLRKCPRQRDRSLKQVISDAIQQSLTEIQEEEEWRKRRQSLYVANKGGGKGGGGAAGEFDSSKKGSRAAAAQFLKLQQNQQQQRRRSSVAASGPLARTNSFDHFRHRGNHVATIASAFGIGLEKDEDCDDDDEQQQKKKKQQSLDDAFDIKKVANLAAGSEVMSSWNNEDEEAAELLESATTAAVTNPLIKKQLSMYARDDVARWVDAVYAAPEVILEYLPSPTPAGDVWGAALTALEMYSARPLVYGAEARDCFFRAAALCGCPSHLTDPDFHRWALHVTRAQLPEMGIRATPLKSLAPLACAAAVDLLSKLLVLDPAERLTAKEALEHPFFSCSM